jgi:glycosyltransferase involved in cell wall biosynthesis
MRALGIGRISVIVPVYNTQEYLLQCLQSLVAQTYVDLEIILINDGSDDDSGRLCDEAAAKDPRIQVIHQQNQGLSAARNVGLEHSRGDYVTFVDSDDWLDNQCLAVLAESLVKAEADVAICRLARVAGENEPAPDTDEWIQSFAKIEGLLFMDRNLSGLIAVSCGKLYKRDLFTAVRFPERRFHEDEFTTYRLLFATERMVIINRMLYYHRTRAESITQSELSYARARDAVQALMERGHFFQQHEVAELAISAHRYMFHLYREYSHRLQGRLSGEEQQAWHRLGQEVYQALKAQPFSLRFRLAYETFFRFR